MTDLDIALYANLIGASLHLLALSRSGYLARRKPKVVVSLDTAISLDPSKQPLATLERALWLGGGTLFFQPGTKDQGSCFVLVNGEDQPFVKVQGRSLDELCKALNLAGV